VYEDIPKALLEHVEDVIFDRRPDATERLVSFASTVTGQGKRNEMNLEWRDARSTGALLTLSFTASSTSSSETSKRRGSRRRNRSR